MAKKVTELVFNCSFFECYVEIEQEEKTSLYFSMSLYSIRGGIIQVNPNQSEKDNQLQ